MLVLTGPNSRSHKTYLLTMPGSLFFSTSILVDVATEYFHIDSPGEQQKIAILTAMGNEPDLLVLDEPAR